MTHPKHGDILITHTGADLERARSLALKLKHRNITTQLDDNPDLREERVQASRYIILCITNAALKIDGVPRGFSDSALQQTCAIAIERDELECTIISVCLEKEVGRKHIDPFLSYDLSGNREEELDKLAARLGKITYGGTNGNAKLAENKARVEGLLGKADAAYFARDYYQSLKYLDVVHKISPDNLAAWRKKAFVQRKSGQPFMAIEASKRVAKLEGSRIGEHFLQALDLFQQNKNEEVLEILQGRRIGAPHWHESFYIEAMALGRLNRYEEALDVCQAWLQVDSEDAFMLYGSIVLLRTMERYNEALLACDQAIHSRPDISRPRLLKCDILTTLERYEEALEVCEDILDASPFRIVKLNKRVSLLKKLKRPEEALLVLEQGCRDHPDPASISSEKATLLMELGRVEEALVAFDQTLASFMKGIKVILPAFKKDSKLNAPDYWLKANPNIGKTYYLKANALVLLNRKDEALQAYEEAIRIGTSEVADLARKKIEELDL